MQLTSRSILLICIILALYLFSVIWVNSEKPIRIEQKVEVHEKIVELTKVKRELVIKQLNHYDTLYLDTFKSTSQGLKQAIDIHIKLDSIL